MSPVTLFGNGNKAFLLQKMGRLPLEMTRIAKENALFPLSKSLIYISEMPCLHLRNAYKNRIHLYGLKASL